MHHNKSLNTANQIQQAVNLKLSFPTIMKSNKATNSTSFFNQIWSKPSNTTDLVYGIFVIRGGGNGYYGYF